MIVRYKEENDAHDFHIDSETWRTINQEKEIETIIIEMYDDRTIFMQTIMPMLDSNTEIAYQGLGKITTKEYHITGKNITIKKKMQLEKQRDRTKELGGTKIAGKYAELEQDFEYLKNLNTDIAEKYQYMLDILPTVKEFSVLLDMLEKTDKKRYNKMRTFNNILIALEKQDVNILPKKYEELESEE